MRKLTVAPIVEGHGDEAAVPILLRRICAELIAGSAIDVLHPIRQPREKLISNKNDCLAKSLGLAVNKLKQRRDPTTHALILLLVDADDDCAAQLGPRVLRLAREIRVDIDVSCVLAVHEFETWLVAGADSLRAYLKPGNIELPNSPEEFNCRKKWIEEWIRTPKYSETVDQPKLTAAMNLVECRRRSPSFDKLCRDLEARFRE